MSNEIKIKGLVNVNGITRDAVFLVPESEARALIKKGFAEPYREKPPAPPKKKTQTQRKGKGSQGGTASKPGQQNSPPNPNQGSDSGNDDNGDNGNAAPDTDLVIDDPEVVAGDEKADTVVTNPADSSTKGKGGK